MVYIPWTVRFSLDIGLTFIIWVYTILNDISPVIHIIQLYNTVAKYQENEMMKALLLTVGVKVQDETGGSHCCAMNWES